MATMQEMVSAVKTYAITHYNEGGWDSIVECYSDSELAEEIEEGKCNTAAEAIAYVGKGCKVWDDYRSDIQATAF
jgi:hypothetical protein